MKSGVETSCFESDPLVWYMRLITHAATLHFTARSPLWGLADSSFNGSWFWRRSGSSSFLLLCCLRSVKRFGLYLFGRAVAGHLNPVLPLVDQDGDDEEDDDGQENAGQNPGRRLVDERHLHLARDVLRQSFTIYTREEWRQETSILIRANENSSSSVFFGCYDSYCSHVSPTDYKSNLFN